MAGKGAAPVPAVEGGFRLADGLSLIGFPAFEKILFCGDVKISAFTKPDLKISYPKPGVKQLF
jgi:hypothetical protein